MAAKFTNRRSLNVKLGKIGEETRREVHLALRRGALRIENRAVEGIKSPPKSGKEYRSKHRKGAIHIASAAGEFPAADSGELDQSITSVDASAPNTIRYETGTNTPYARRLELGGAHTAENGAVITIEPRPFMAPAFDENVAQVRTDIQAAVRRGVRKATR